MKKVLIITYYWPPAGGPGVQRWLKFVKYLPSYGVQPIVYTPENPSYPTLDDSLCREVPKSVTVLKKSIFEPHQLGKIIAKNDISTYSAGIINEASSQSLMQQWMLYVRGNFFIPDARVLWVRPSIKFLKKYMDEKSIETIITTGPPHSLHLIGQSLKKHFPNVRWIADFRDPWVNIDYHEQLKFRQHTQQKHILLEKQILDQADQVIVTSYETLAEFSSKTSTPIELITNGYDELDSLDVDVSENFSVMHVGSLVSTRNPVVLWEAFAQLIDENPLFRQFFELHLVGKVSQTILDTIESLGLKKYVFIDGYLPHLEALKMQHQAQLLLLIEANQPQKKGIIPGKVFEYMLTQRPILAMGPEKWDVIQLLEQTKAGKVFNYHEKQEVFLQLKAYFQEYLAGKLKVESADISCYSRKNLTEKLSKIL